MKNRISVFVVGLIAGIILSLFMLQLVLPGKMVVEYESKYDFAQTVEAIKTSAAKNNWSMPHTYDLQATMKKNNFDIQPVKVFSLCKPEHAQKILSGNTVRAASAIMPCRVSVYEKEGKTYVSMLNAGLASKFMGKTLKNILGEVSEESMLILDSVIKN